MWYLKAEHPEGKWKKKIPYPSREKAELQKEGMERMYDLVGHGFRPKMQVVYEEER